MSALECEICECNRFKREHDTNHSNEVVFSCAQCGHTVYVQIVHEMITENTEYSDLSEHDREIVDQFEVDLEMMYDISERWNISSIEAGVWLENNGYM